MITTIWAELLVATLADAGVTTCVLSPGSRSTPLACALATEPRIDVVTIIDERAAAFYALGVARATGRPAALVCTSGTAAAHYLPAIVEASQANVPMIAITADRPPELQACGASQTIDQLDLYGGFVRLAIDVGAPVDAEGALRALRRKVLQSVIAARGPYPGPVHLEVPFRKPLDPVPVRGPLADFARSLVGPVHAAAPALVADRALVAAFVADCERVREGVIVASAPPLAGVDLRALARATGYPILAESGSGVRFGDPAGATIVERADLMTDRPRPALVIRAGGDPVAPLFNDVPAWVLTDRVWQDPEGTARGVIAGALGEVSLVRNPDEAWLAKWRAADARAARVIDAAIASVPDGEHVVIRDAIAALPANAIVCVGNSLPVRVIDHVAARRDGITVLTQRGAAGIDGLIASATGATHAGRPVLLILGDVSFAHDVGALLVARDHARAPLSILVIDNGGGQIFAGLPIARTISTETLTDTFLTPPALDVGAIAAAFGVRDVTHARVVPDGVRRVRARCT